MEGSVEREAFPGYGRSVIRRKSNVEQVEKDDGVKEILMRRDGAEWDLRPWIRSMMGMLSSGIACFRARYSR